MPEWRRDAQQAQYERKAQRRSLTPSTAYPSRSPTQSVEPERLSKPLIPDYLGPKQCSTAPKFGVNSNMNKPAATSLLAQAAAATSCRVRGTMGPSVVRRPTRKRRSPDPTAEKY